MRWPTGGALLPLGYKGFGLAIFGELLSGVLTGSRILQEIPAWHQQTHAAVANGHLHIAIDIATFADPGVFKARADALVDMLKAAPLLPDVQEILMPGERAWRAQQRNEREGIPVRRARHGGSAPARPPARRRDSGEPCRQRSASSMRADRSCAR